MKISNFLILVLLIVGISSCKTSRRLIKAPLKEEGADYLFSKMQENEFKFNTIQAKLAIEYKNNHKFLEFKGQVRIVKDSLIWISFNQDLGIEIARLLITQDSVKFLDRFNKKFFIGDYDFVNNFLNSNIDFGILQSIILGNDFEYYENAKFRASIDDGQYRLNTSDRRKLKKHVRNQSDEERIFLQSIWLNPENFKINQIKIKELTKDSKKLMANYSDFQALEGQIFPMDVAYELEAKTPLSVKVKYSRITLNQDLSFPFKIPSKYTPAN